MHFLISIVHGYLNIFSISYQYIAFILSNSYIIRFQFSVFVYSMDDASWKFFAGIGCSTVAAISIGYLLYQKGQKNGYSHMVKSLAPGTKSYQEEDNPIMMYVIDHATIHPSLKKLHNLSVSHPKGIYTTAIEQDVFLTILSKSLNAKKALDIGMFYGCSALSLALGVADGGKVVGLEITAEYIKNGSPFFAEAGVSDKIDIRIKDAGEGMAELIKNGEGGTYDIVSLDACKARYPNYLEPIYTLLRPGGLLVIDNALYHGTVIDPQADTEDTCGIRKLNNMLKNDHRFEIVMLKVVDGILIARKIE